MADLSNPTGGGGFDYVQAEPPGDPVEGQEWYDTDDDAAYVYDGAAWVEQTVVDHSQLSGVGANDHIDNLTDIPTRNHDDLSGINSGDHHSRYTDSEARSANYVVEASGEFTHTWDNPLSVYQQGLNNPTETDFRIADHNGNLKGSIHLNQNPDSGVYVMCWSNWKDSDDGTRFLTWELRRML